eukprot:TRINITY_DN8552_c0_g1_i3.p1 TRINITY_DN8552_c0_g1~~TRINITY_DN8552_c0_g1_i3.p1  ORF type:complete len:142 (+),score=5.05 TRINITY_DN8552_c0_g1_i3:135-560(+)
MHHLTTGVSLGDAEPLVLALISGTLLAAIGALGDRGEFEDEDVTTSYPRTIMQRMELDDLGPLFGFSKASELFVARLAELTIAASLLGELLTGQGALQHLNVPTGVPLSQVEPALLWAVGFLLLAAAHPGRGRFVGEKDAR